MKGKTIAIGDKVSVKLLCAGCINMMSCCHKDDEYCFRFTPNSGVNMTILVKDH